MDLNNISKNKILLFKLNKKLIILNIFINYYFKTY